MDHILKCHDIAKISFVRGENCTLYDERGKRYVDFESGIWSTVLGHSHPRINRVMSTQIGQVIHLGPRFPGFLAEEAARDVLDITGSDDGKCVFLSSGSEAVEFAVQATRRVTGKHLLLTFTNSYLGAYGSSGRKSADEWHLFDWDVCANADHSDCLKEIPFERIGGFAFEPGGSGLGFVRFPPKQLVQSIVQRARQEGGLLVANEVTTGMGRTGKWFGFQHYDIQPDIVALGKGLGNGYPVSAVAMKRDVAEKLENSGFRYVQSHQNDPLGCSVAQEVIAVLCEENWVERGDAIGAYFLERLKQLGERHALVKEARGRGMLLALEFHPHETFSATSASQSLLEQGFLVGYYPAGNILRFDPALTIEKKDVAHLLDCLDRILETAAQF
jgi:acetylornithine aminotransferase